MNTTLINEMNNSLDIAEKSAYSYTKERENYNTLTKGLNKLKSIVGGVSPFWIIMSFVGIPLGVVFAIYEANMAQQAIMTLLDPLGVGSVNKMMVSVIGAGLAIFAMFLGHIFSEGFQNETNDISGTIGKKMGAPFYFSIVGLLGYIAFQYYLVQAAGEGGDQFASFAMIAIGVAILEILVGILILGKSLSYMLIFFNTIRLWFTVKGMGKQSHRTSKSYRLYRSKLQLWNSENPTSLIELEGNENIRQAIMYYGGIKLEEDATNLLQKKIKLRFNERLN